MFLETDNQTIEDLGLFSKHDQKGIYDIYNNTFTRGGEKVLERFFKNPLANRELIVKRLSIISAFAAFKVRFPFTPEVLDNVEKYSAHASDSDNEKKSTMGEKEISNGVIAVIQFFHELRHFLEQGVIIKIDELKDERMKTLAILNAPSLEPVFNQKPLVKLSYSAITAYDVLLRTRGLDKILLALDLIYKIDVFISVANVANNRGFNFPVAVARKETILRIQGIYHPGLALPVVNDFEMSENKNVVFLTGSNMAGKSTFLRSVATALYIAHMGFPVSAKSMEFSVRDGIYTTINLPDNLGIGASHFYAEALRVKKIAIELNADKSLFVIFDELFRGTNVKDAEEGTIAVTKAFAGRSNSLFLISSHIVEAGESLSENPAIGFCYLPTHMNGHIPEYTYRIEQGISADRHGMIIIRNEGILNILENGKKVVDNHIKLK